MAFDDAAEALRRGGVLLLSTDTLPGIHCRADNQEAVLRVAGLKGRDSGKPLLVLAGSLQQALDFCGPLQPSQLAFCQACWPGPFSLILPAGSRLASRVSCGLGTVAIRVPAHKGIRQLINEVGSPLVSTSANMQNEPPVRDLAEAFLKFKNTVDGAFGSQEYSSCAAVASALVDLCGEKPVILRPGPLDIPCSE